MSAFYSQRLARNDFLWRRPSPLRLGREGEGQYLHEHGFGYEDWNFNVDLAVQGAIYGYTYYIPAEAKQEQPFNFAFVTFDSGVWSLVGFYFNARFEPTGAPESPQANLLKARDLRAMGMSLGPKLRRLPDDKLQAHVAKQVQPACHWRVACSDVVALPQPIPLPMSLYDSKHYRVVTPKELSPANFSAIWNFSQQYISIPSLSDELDHSKEYLEGRFREAIHVLRERNPALVRDAKRAFKAKHGRLYCEGCGFDFGKAYGEFAQDYIEAHHKMPVAELAVETTVSPADLVLLCANCHRVVHLREDCLTLDELKDALAQKPSSLTSVTSLGQPPGG